MADNLTMFCRGMVGNLWARKRNIMRRGNTLHVLFFLKLLWMLSVGLPPCFSIQKTEIKCFLHILTDEYNHIVGKGKVHPGTGHKSPEGEYKYSSTLYLTSALDGVGGQRHTPAALPPGRPGTLCTGGWVVPRTGLYMCGKSHPPPEFDPRTVQSIASRYTGWAILAPIIMLYYIILCYFILYYIIVYYIIYCVLHCIILKFILCYIELYYFI
jgi:hypothetical protein